MKSSLKLMYGVVFVAANAMAASTVTVCKSSNECKTVDSLESLEILTNSKGDGGAVKVFSTSLYAKVSGDTTNPPPVDPPHVDPPPANGDCPAPLMTQQFIDYPIGTNTQFPSMVKDEVLVIKLVPPVNHSGKIAWGPAVGTEQMTEKIGVISTCPGVINSNINNETVFPCRRSRNQDSLAYTTRVNPSFDQCQLQAGKTYYVNIFSGYDLKVTDAAVDTTNDCPSGTRCDISLNVH